jgi:hypothetical protein
MPMNPVQFQPGLSTRGFLSLYGTDEHCVASPADSGARSASLAAGRAATRRLKEATCAVCEP